MSGVADLARLRALCLLVRTYPAAVGDKISLSKVKNILAFASDDHAKAFLAFHGLQIVIEKESRIEGNRRESDGHPIRMAWNGLKKLESYMNMTSFD